MAVLPLVKKNTLVYAPAQNGTLDKSLVLLGSKKHGHIYLTGHPVFNRTISAMHNNLTQFYNLLYVCKAKFSQYNILNFVNCTRK